MARMKKIRYGVHPSVAYGRSVLDHLPEKTGKSADEWVRLVQRKGPAGERERRAWLKSEHGLGMTTAMLIAQAAGDGRDQTDPEAYLAAAPAMVDAMYADRAALRPIHDRLLELGLALGSDAKACPCKTIVPLYREHVFAEIKPATRKRVDLGLALKGAKRKPPARLVDTGGLAKGDRITHRIPIAGVKEIDATVERWLGIAYELDG